MSEESSTPTPTTDTMFRIFSDLLSRPLTVHDLECIAGRVATYRSSRLDTARLLMEVARTRGYDAVVFRDGSRAWEVATTMTATATTATTATAVAAEAGADE